MCFSALVLQDLERLAKELDAIPDEERYADLLETRTHGGSIKVPKALDDALLARGGRLTELVRDWRLGQASGFEQELFKQKKRLADAERMLQTKETKKALNDQRIAGNKIDQLKIKIDDLRRKEGKPRDSRIFPGVYSSVVVEENDKRIIRPMRYQCRPAGKPAFYDTKYPGTYNARRDSLEGFWKGQFGQTHGLIIATTFYENVEGPDGKNKVLEFIPQTGEPMLIACLWSHWIDPKGKEPDLYSFAAITDEPEPEVAAAGHDRTIINIKPEHVDAWLHPNGDLTELYAIFDDKQHPYYEHREAA